MKKRNNNYKRYIFRKIKFQMPKKLTQEFIEEKIVKAGDKLDSGYIYKNVKNKLNIICGKCGNKYEILWHNFNSRGSNCTCKSLDKLRINMIPFSKFKKILNDENYTTEYDGSNYTGTSHKILTKCPNDHDYETCYSNFVNKKRRCMTCYKLGIKPELPKYENPNKIEKMTSEVLRRRTIEIYGENRYEFIDLPNNIDLNDYIQIKCLNIKCGIIFTKQIHNFIRKTNFSGCSICTLNERKVGLDEFIRRSKELFGNKFDYSKFIYVNMKTHGIIICNDCKNEFEQAPRHHLAGHNGCDFCIQSGGEKMIHDSLTKNNITFIPQHPLGKLRFDFHLPNFKTYIEFDGCQHMEHVEHFHTEKEFKEQQRRDEIKNEYCWQIYPLLRIAYYQQKQIKILLKEFLTKVAKFNICAKEIKDIYKTNPEKGYVDKYEIALKENPEYIEEKIEYFYWLYEKTHKPKYYEEIT